QNRAGNMTAVAAIEGQRLENEYNLAFDIYRNFSTELEQLKVKLNQDTPVFTVVESVRVPYRRSFPRRRIIMMFSCVVGVMLGIVFIGYKQYLSGYFRMDKNILTTGRQQEHTG